MTAEKPKQDFVKGAFKGLVSAYPDANIFLDIDGVVADFDAHATAHGKYDDKGQPKWDTLDLAWWKSMPAFNGARAFYDALAKQAPVKFLTAPVPSTDCFTGKAEWVQGFLPERGKFALLDLIICHSKAKQFLAAPRNILIDDRQKNIDEWQAAGGIGILHDGDFAKTLQKLDAALKGACAPQTPRPPVRGH